MCCEFGFVNSITKKILENRAEIISAFEQNGSKIKGFQNPEQREFDESLLKWFKQQSSDDIPVSGLLLLIIFVLPKFQL